MSRIGVPSRRSAPSTWMMGPASPCSMLSIFTQVRPIGLGLKGLRVAKTPTRSVPPRRGGRTVGDQLSLAPALFAVALSVAMSAAVPPGVPFSNCQMSHRWLKLSSPATAASSANSGSNTIEPCRCGAKKLLRGMPNFCGRSV